MTLAAQSAVITIWSGVGVVWLVAALVTKRVARTQSRTSRLAHVGLLLAAGVLLFSPAARWGWLSTRIAPDGPASVGTGFLFTLLGAVFAVWARLVLGGNWSGRVTIKQEHEVIQRGPYAVVRHPIYSGLLLAGLGTALVFGSVAGFLGVTLAFVGWWTKARLEERYLRATFGKAYADYCGRVKALVPFVL